MRIAWRVGFYVTSLAIAVWLGVNLVNGKYFDQLGHFLPATVMLFVVTGIVYAFAFRVGDATFTNLNLSLAVLGVMFLASEVGIRVWDRYDPIFRPVQLEENIPFKRHEFSPYRPGGTGSTHGHPVRINALGFRGQEHSTAKPPGVFRIIVLGDSFTIGTGVAEDEMYTTVLEKELRARFPTKPIELINLGVGGWSAVDEIKLLEKVGPLLKPDLVIVGFVGNDVREGDQVLESEKNRWAIPLPERLKNALVGSSKLFSWFTIKYDQLLMKAGIRPNAFTSLESAYDSNSVEWRKFVAAYEKMVAWTKERGLPPPLVGLLITTPSHDSEQNDFVTMTPIMALQYKHMQQVKEALNRMGIPTVEFFDLFKRHNKQDLTVSRWEGHPGAVPHRLYAEGFGEAILRLRLIQ